MLRQEAGSEGGGRMGSSGSSSTASWVEEAWVEVPWEEGGGREQGQGLHNATGWVGRSGGVCVSMHVCE